MIIIIIDLCATYYFNQLIFVWSTNVEKVINKCQSPVGGVLKMMSHFPSWQDHFRQTNFGWNENRADNNLNVRQC